MGSSFRKANYQAILEAISKRDDPQPPRFKASYAEALKTTAAEIKTQQPSNQGAHEEGSTVVTRRKAQNKSHKKSKPKLSQHIASLMAQGRCFKCLDWGHKQYQCRNGVKCIKCLGIGHVSWMCKSTNTGETPEMKGISERPHPHPVHHHTKNQDTHTTKVPQTEEKQAQKMELENWETLPMLPQGHVNSGRTDELKIFFPPTDELRPPNTLLHKSSTVHVGPYRHSRHLPYRLVMTLAATFGCHLTDFTVCKLHPASGDYIVIFPNRQTRDQAVRMGIFTVARGMEVQLATWTPNSGMVRDPSSHKARIKLHGVPLQYWNMHDLNHLVSGFSYVVRMAPVFANGNFETLRVLVACYNPVTVPPSLWLTKDPYSVIVRVELEGWLHNSSPLLQQPQMNGDEGSSNFGPDWSDEEGQYHQLHQRRDRHLSQRTERTPGRYTGGSSQNHYRRERPQWLPRGEMVPPFQGANQEAVNPRRSASHILLDLYALNRLHQSATCHLTHNKRSV